MKIFIIFSLMLCFGCSIVQGNSPGKDGIQAPRVPISEEVARKYFIDYFAEYSEITNNEDIINFSRNWTSNLMVISRVGGSVDKFGSRERFVTFLVFLHSQVRENLEPIEYWYDHEKEVMSVSMMIKNRDLNTHEILGQSQAKVKYHLISKGNTNSENLIQIDRIDIEIADHISLKNSIRGFFNQVGFFLHYQSIVD